MRLTGCAAIVYMVLAGGCSQGSSSLGRARAVSIEASPGLAPPAGAAPSSATADCAGIDSQAGGGAAYLRCIERHE